MDFLFLNHFILSATKNKLRKAYQKGEICFLTMHINDGFILFAVHMGVTTGLTQLLLVYDMIIVFKYLPTTTCFLVLIFSYILNNVILV